MLAIGTRYHIYGGHLSGFEKRTKIEFSTRVLLGSNTHLGNIFASMPSNGYLMEEEKQGLRKSGQIRFVSLLKKARQRLE